MFSSFSTSSLSFSATNKPTYRKSIQNDAAAKFSKITFDIHFLYFDRVIGALEEIISSDEFSDAQQDFLDQHCDTFDENLDENKLEYKEC